VFAWGFGQSLYSLAITITVLIFCKGGRQTIAMKRKICLAQLLQGRCDVERGGDVAGLKRGQHGAEAAQGEGEVIGAGPPVCGRRRVRCDRHDEQHDESQWKP